MNGVLDDLRISRRNRDVTANEFRRFDGKEGRCEMCEVRCPSNRGGTDADVVTRTSFENPCDVLVRDLVLCMVDQ